jgi:hypothetical protein
MLMRQTRRAKTLDQLDLFLPPPQRPTWDQMPAPATRKVVELLAELLRQHRARKPLPASRKGAADE